MWLLREEFARHREQLVSDSRMGVNVVCSEWWSGAGDGEWQ